MSLSALPDSRAAAADPPIDDPGDNQSAPLVDVNLFLGNTALRDALAHHLPTLDTTRLVSLGAAAGSAGWQNHARLANWHPPELHSHDAAGRRIDEVEFHPSYHALLGLALEHGLHGTPWVRGPGSHVERAAAFMLATELEPSTLCPVSMSYAATPALRANPALASAWGARLAATRYAPGGRASTAQHVSIGLADGAAPAAALPAATLGMGMTERQGGSDVRSNTSRAERLTDDTPWGSAWRLVGHKWFFSAPMCDAHLVLAQTGAGLGCFFMPRFLPDWWHGGAADAPRRNAVHIQRLKHKLGNHANASAEVEFDGALAWLIGEAGRGVAQILAMGALTRLDCALGTAGLMRHAVSLAIHHGQQRRAFGRRLVEHPLMQNVLADLALESEAATALALRLAVAVDRCETGEDAGGHEARLRRLLTPIGKYWICKRGAALAQEAMECLGGNGYVEAQGAGVMARIYREMPVNSIWEGAGNIQALDLLRVLRSGPAAGGSATGALADELAAARPRNRLLDRHVAQLLTTIQRGPEEGDARRVAQDLALALQAATLAAHAPDWVFEAFCRARLADDSRLGAYGSLPAGLPLAALIERARPASACTPIDTPRR